MLRVFQLQGCVFYLDCNPCGPDFRFGCKKNLTDKNSEKTINSDKTSVPAMSLRNVPTELVLFGNVKLIIWEDIDNKFIRACLAGRIINFFFLRILLI